MIIALALPAPSRSSEEPAASPEGSPANTTEPERTSHWGPLPPESEETTASPESQGDPAWEHAVNLPYNVAMFPVKATWYLAEETVEYVDETQLIQRIGRYVPLHLGPMQVTPGVSFGSQGGIGGSLAIDVPEFLGPHNPMKLRLSGEQKGSRKATLGVRYHRHRASVVEVGAGYRSDHNARYYGLGPFSTEDRESYYRREVAWGGVTWKRTLAEDYSVQFLAMYSGVNGTGTSHSDDPHLSEEFEGEIPPGYREQSDGSTIGVELAHDGTRKIGPPQAYWRDAARPESGGVRRLSATWFEGRSDSKAAFLTWRAEVQQFVPLWHTNRALAVRGFLSKIENDRREPVPFQRLLSNDDPDVLRGYPDGRFRGIGLAALSLEYRWPLWNDSALEDIGADAYGFVDYGQIFDDFEDLQMNRVKGSWGGGLRIGGFGFFMARAEVGFSDEGTEFRLRADQIFQYAKGGLYDGRDPVPDR